MELEHRPEWLLAFRAGYTARRNRQAPSALRQRAKWLASKKGANGSTS